ncbi:hypothetical protein LINPERHAP1_LOCUS4827 [Linum perenne]
MKDYQIFVTSVEKLVILTGFVKCYFTFPRTRL